MIKDAHQKAAAFFDEFVEAFRTFDGTIVAERYYEPFIAVHADETIECLQSASEIAVYFQSFLDGYYSDGCKSCGYKDLEVLRVGESCLMSTVTWELYDVDRVVLTSWRESYNIVQINSKLLVLSSINHAA